MIPNSYCNIKSTSNLVKRPLNIYPMSWTAYLSNDRLSLVNYFFSSSMENFSWSTLFRVFVNFNKQGERILAEARGHLVFYRHKSWPCFGDNKSSHSSLSLFLIIVNLGHAPPCFLVWLYIFLHYRYHFLPVTSAKEVKVWL